VKHVSPDGSKVEYSRLGNQEIGKLVIVDPATKRFILQLEGQQSYNDEFIERLSAGIVQGLVKGAMLP